jgi:uncharacterized membrane protein YGL010W
MIKLKSADEWLKIYAKTHQDPRNQLIHKISVPIIYWSTFAFIWALAGPQISWLLMCAVLVFYMMLGLNHFMEMAIVSMLVMGGVMVVEALGPNLLWTSAALFVLAWAAQFYGHKLEGKAPAFMDNLLFLLIGPLWCLNSFLGRLKNDRQDKA